MIRQQILTVGHIRSWSAVNNTGIFIYFFHSLGVAAMKNCKSTDAYKYLHTS